MDFLVIVSALLILMVSQDLRVIQRDGWLGRFNAAVDKVVPSDIGSFLVALLIPVFLLFFLDYLVGRKMFGLTGYFLSLLVLLYTFGRGNLDQDVNHFMTDISRNDLQAAYHDVVAFNEAHRPSEAEDWAELHREAVANIGYRYFEHYFAVIFWFLVAGPAGALLYRLSQLNCDRETESAYKAALRKRFLWLMEWLPVRLLGFTFMIVGNFVSALRPSLESLLDVKSASVAVICNLVYGALDVDYEAQIEQATGEEAHIREVIEVSAIQKLFHRALIAAVCLIGVVVIFAD